jgi:hypothetical protein
VDGKLVGTSTNQVWSGQERFQLQVEPSGHNDGGTGHVYVNWVWIGTPSGSSSSSGSGSSGGSPPPPPPSPPSNTASPTISGTPQQGSTLTASTGSWTNNPTSYAYQWRDCTTSGCSNIGGATSSTYTLTSSDVGDKIDVVVTATNAGGSGSATSSQVGPVTGSSASTGTGTIQHVVWVWLENTGYTGIIGNGSASYINQLANTYGLATNYFAVGHPSAPNYIAATSGTDGSCCTDDGYHQLNVPSIFSQLPGGQSRSLEEGMPSNCDTSDGGNSYAIRHNPMAYYLPVIGADCNNYDVPLNNSAPDLSAKFTFVTPNTCNDMHDCSTQTGDTWLSNEIPAMMNTPQYQAGTTAIFITWDEDGNGYSDGNKVAMIVVSPYTHGVKDATSYTHWSLLRTTEEILGLPLLGNAATANSMLGKFGF